MKANKRILYISAFILLLIITAILSYWVIQLKNENDYLKRTRNQYELLSPGVAWMDVNTFLDNQKTYTVTFSDLKPVINSIITTETKGHYGFYLEDLTSGAWLGINEKEKFYPASLFKLPLMIAVLKKIEEGKISLDEQMTVQEKYIDDRSGVMASQGVNYNITIEYLLSELIKYSDNTAYNMLLEKVSNEEHLAARLAVGLPLPSADEVYVLASAKDYSNMLRSLYISSYLKRPFSELALSIMVDTDFNSALPAGLPKGVKIAHKVGFYSEGNYFHDCGIVYLPKKPYIICVMSKDNTEEEANIVISSLSKTAYDYMSKKGFSLDNI